MTESVSSQLDKVTLGSATVSKSLGLTIGSIIEQNVCVAPEALTQNMLVYFKNTDLEGLVVLKEQQPVGLLMRNQLYYQLGTTYGISLYLGRPVGLLMDDKPLIVDYETSLEIVSQWAMHRSKQHLYDLIIVTSSGYYSGVVSIMNLLNTLTTMRIQLAANANPLTHLPGNLIIEERLKNNVAAGLPFAVLYIDLDNFKAFNDLYGFEHGDKVLVFTANLLRDCVQTHSVGGNDFLGHIGGDDFIIITCPDKMEVLCKNIVKKFDHNIRDYYQNEDIKKGYITIRDRKGRLDLFPIMSLSIGIAHNLHQQFNNYLEVGEVAADLKKKAKEIPGSVWVTDKRNNNSACQTTLLLP